MLKRIQNSTTGGTQPNIDIKNEFSNLTANDPQLTRLNSALNQYQTELRTLEGKIKKVKNKLAQTERNLAQVREKQQLEKELASLSKELADKRLKLDEERVALLKKIAEISVKLDTVLPEAAKKALTQMQAQANEANKMRLREEARRRQEEGNRLQNQATEAEGRILELITRRYLTTRVERGKIRAQTNIALLQADFNNLMTDGVDTLINQIMTNDNQLRSLPVEVRNEVLRKVREKVYQTIVSEAIIRLRLDENTIRALATSDEFIKAAESAIQKDQKIKETLEKITGQELTGKSALKKALEKMPFGGLLGIISLILFGSWFLIAQAGKK